MKITLENEKGTFSVSAEDFASEFETVLNLDDREDKQSPLQARIYGMMNAKVRKQLLDFLQGYGHA